MKRDLIRYKVSGSVYPDTSYFLVKLPYCLFGRDPPKKDGEKVPIRPQENDPHPWSRRHPWFRVNGTVTAPFRTDLNPS